MALFENIAMLYCSIQRHPNITISRSFKDIHFAGHVLNHAHKEPMNAGPISKINALHNTISSKLRVSMKQSFACPTHIQKYVHMVQNFYYWIFCSKASFFPWSELDFCRLVSLARRALPYGATTFHGLLLYFSPTSSCVTSIVSVAAFVASSCCELRSPWPSQFCTVPKAWY